MKHISLISDHHSNGHVFKMALHQSLTHGAPSFPLDPTDVPFSVPVNVDIL
jgi:hypothetical protein